MPGTGSIDFELTEQVAAELVNDVHALNAKLPQNVKLSRKAKAGLAKMGAKSVDFVESSLAHAQKNPALAPAAVIDVAAWAKDYQLARNGQTVLTELRSLVEQFDDAVTLAGAEAMEAALLYYGVIQAVAEKVPGMKGVADDLGKRFKRARAAADEPGTPEVK